MLNQPLYKIDSKGKIRVWTIDVIHEENSSIIRIVAGLDTGKKVTSDVTVYEGKNSGKTNETDHYTQAVSEAEAKYALQIRSGYVTDPANAKQATLASGMKAPMLAKKFDATGKQKDSKTLDQLKLRGQSIIVQPKIDGNRCLIKITTDSIELYTRKGDRMLPIPHIEEQISSAFAGKLAEGEEVVLDGELFSDKISFNTLNGLLKKEDKSPERIEQMNTIKYHLYDMFSELGYEERNAKLTDLFTPTTDYPAIDVLESHKIIADEEEINKYLEKFLAEGHEGLMIRRLGMPYEHKRSQNLLKNKVFEDREFKLVDIIPDVRGPWVGAFVMEMDCIAHDRDRNLLSTFKAGVSGLSQEEGIKFLAEKEKFIGKQATVEYFGRSEYLIPRFPKFKGIRE